MKLTHFFIEHPRFAIVLNVFIVLAGVATMLRCRLPSTQHCSPDHKSHNALPWRLRRCDRPYGRNPAGTGNQRRGRHGVHKQPIDG